MQPRLRIKILVLQPERLVRAGNIRLAVFVGPVMYLRQGFVGIWVGVEIGIPAVRLHFLQEVAAVPNKSGYFFEAV